MPPRYAPLLTATLVAALVFVPAQAVETRVYEYDMPSSFVVRDVFGFGVLVCHYPELAPLAGTVRNGPCIDYSGFEGRPYRLSSNDLFSTPSLTLAVDVDGDGCVSGSCGERDYRANACGVVSGILPYVDPGVKPIIEVYVRAADLDPTSGDLCMGSHGTITVEYG